MITLSEKGSYVFHGRLIVEDNGNMDTAEINRQLSGSDLAPITADQIDKETARAGTIAHQILTQHNRSNDPENLKIRFDSLGSHDITYVGIVQTSIASGLKAFPVPYALTNCHNSLCAVGGTINEDDHVFGLSAAHKYGGIFVPAHLAVIHQYVREMMAGCGKMILCSDSHSRYGALGTMGIGEGGPEIVKQLLELTYDIPRPEVIAVFLEGQLSKGIGPLDVALAIVGAVFDSGFVKNKIMEFIGPGIKSLSVDFRNGIDVMTTETTCLSSIWSTDDKIKDFYERHGRGDVYEPLSPESVAYYDGLMRIDLSKIRPMIALPFHPSNVHSISDFKENALDILRNMENDVAKIFDAQGISFSLVDKIEGDRIKIDQGVVAGCCGGLFENICAIADILRTGTVDTQDFSLSVYPASQPINHALMKNQIITELVAHGIVTRSAFCGPCFGAGDIPSNGAFSIRHTTRNFPNREGSKPDEGQMSAVALMDARSIAATCKNGGYLTSITELEEYEERDHSYRFENDIYEKKVYFGFNNPLKGADLIKGPNIVDWPKMDSMPPNLLLKVVSILKDPVTTTDELIPSGETSSYRSNPLRLAEFTLSRKDPGYVNRAKQVQKLYHFSKENSVENLPDDIKHIYKMIAEKMDDSCDIHHIGRTTGIGSLVCAVKPGDGSAREQAASCQKILGTWANLANEYATKRYRSNCINWGIIPLVSTETMASLSVGMYIYLPGIRKSVESASEEIIGWIIGESELREIPLQLPDLTEKDRKVLLAGNLINYQSGAI